MEINLKRVKHLAIQQGPYECSYTEGWRNLSNAAFGHFGLVVSHHLLQPHSDRPSWLPAE